MTDKLGREELLNELDQLEKLRFVGDKLSQFEHIHTKELTFKQSKTLNIIYKEIWEYAHRIGELRKQIVALIKKPEVDEAWIEGKAREMCKIANVEFFIYATDFVRSIVDEIQRVS